ncbi:MAG: YqaE/Pmp3 family membrane protein [Chitinophagaceae bacterium]
MRKGLLTVLAGIIIFSSFNSLQATIVVPVTTNSEKPDRALVKGAMEAFRSLPKAERREKIKDAKKALKAYNEAKKAGKEPSTNTILLVILALLLPPLAVYLHEGVINKRFWISLLLTILFFVPGVIYALIVILGDH